MAVQPQTKASRVQDCDAWAVAGASGYTSVTHAVLWLANNAWNHPQIIAIRVDADSHPCRHALCTSSTSHTKQLHAGPLPSHAHQLQLQLRQGTTCPRPPAFFYSSPRSLFLQQCNATPRYTLRGSPPSAAPHCARPPTLSAQRVSAQLQLRPEHGWLAHAPHEHRSAMQRLAPVVWVAGGVPHSRSGCWSCGTANQAPNGCASCTHSMPVSFQYTVCVCVSQPPPKRALLGCGGQAQTPSHPHSRHLALQSRYPCRRQRCLPRRSRACGMHLLQRRLCARHQFTVLAHL